MDDRDKDRGRERDRERDRERGEESYPRSYGGGTGVNRYHEDGNNSGNGQEVRTASDLFQIFLLVHYIV